MKVLTDPALPLAVALERALLTSLIALEERGPAWAVSALIRHGTPSADAQRLPLVRVLTAAWPGAWAQPDASQRAVVGDLATIPPFPRLAERLAAALSAAGRGDLAEAHLLAVLAFHRSHGAAQLSLLARRLRFAVVTTQCRNGTRGTALWTAVRNADVAAFLRCLVPF